MNVLAIVPYHIDYCAGQRFRIELWAKELKKRNIDVKFLCYSNETLTDTLYQTGKPFSKAYLLIKAFISQIIQVYRSTKPDLVFIYREASLAGPAIIERAVRRWNVPIVYDLDEPLFVPYKSPTNGFMNKLKFFSKCNDIAKLSTKVFAVNHVIADHMSKYNEDVDIVPMTVDIERYKPSTNKIVNKSPKIVWVGTRSNQPNIHCAVPSLKRLGTEFDFDFRIIADDPMSLDGVNVDFHQWSYDKEVSLLQESDIGLTPVLPSDWSPWKFFFKTIQYFSVGIPVIGSNTGSNIGIIEHGKNGFLVDSEDEWYEKIKFLIENPDVRKEMGVHARKTVMDRFTLSKQFDFVEQSFKNILK